MASSKYYFLIDRKTTDAGGVTKIFNPAKLWDFGSGITNLASLKSYIMDLFYLDEIKLIAINVSGTVRYGFRGYVIPGGANAKMRKSTRLVEVKLTTPTATMWLLNDAGLNTKGKVTISAINSDLANGGINMTAIYKASFIFDTNFSLRARKYGDTVWTDMYYLKGIAKNTSFTDTNRKVDIDYYLPLEAGDIIEVQPYSTNTEGPWMEAPIQTVTIAAYLRQFRYGTTAKSADEATYLVDAYIATKVADLDTIFYANSFVGARMPAGFYMNPTDRFYFELDSNGKVINKDTYIPFVELNYIVSAIRTGDGSTFGGYTLSLDIINAYAGGQLSDYVTFKIGVLNNPADPVSDANLITIDSQMFDPVTVAAYTTNSRTKTGSIPNEMSIYTWAYVVLKSGEQIGSGIFPL